MTILSANTFENSLRPYETSVKARSPYLASNSFFISSKKVNGILLPIIIYLIYYYI